MWPVWPSRPDSTGWRRRSSPSPTTSGWRTEATTPSIRSSRCPSWLRQRAKVKLLTFVLVAGYRNPYLAAKALASLDKLSGGRVVAGMAAGYLRSEFTVSGADWDHRERCSTTPWTRCDAVGSGETVEIGGPFPASGHTQLPLPSRVGGPPVWIGGNSGAARRRVADKGDGWMPIAQGEAMAKITRTPPLESIAQLAEMVADIERRRAERAAARWTCASHRSATRRTRRLGASRSGETCPRTWMPV